MRTWLVILLCAALLLPVGCASRRKPPASTPPGAGQGSNTPAPAPGAGGASRLDAVDNPAALTIDELAAGLTEYVAKGAPGERIRGLLARWNLKAGEGRMLVAEADVDGDGQAEVVLALNGKGGGVTGLGTLFLIDGTRVVRSPDEVAGAALHAVNDLTGDGRPEIIWSSTDVGAHTAHSRVFVTAWDGQNLLHLGAPLEMASMKVEVSGTDLLLHGGLIGSVGAGDAQREMTERYRWTNGTFQLVDRQYMPSRFSYHKLIDGITAEEFGRNEDALTAYLDATDATRKAAGEWLEPDQAAAFPEAVRAFARMRRAVLLLGLGRPSEAQTWLEGAEGRFAGLPAAVKAARDPEAGCRAAQAWVAGHTEFLEAINSVMGYANPRWSTDTLCGPLPPGE